MSHPDPIRIPPAVSLLAALREGRWDQAARVLAAGGDAPSHDEIRSLAEMLMRRRQWPQAAWLWAQLPAADLDAGSVMKHRLAANLAALQQHRPEVYDLLLALPPQNRFSIGVSTSGKPTIHCRQPDGTLLSLSSGPDPLAAAAAAMTTLYGRTKAGDAVALCGLGDGYLAVLLAQNPPALFMDKQQAVFLIEPEPQVLLQCLMIHDFSGVDGPIAAGRFQWFVGAEWEQAMHAALDADPFLPAPSFNVSQGLDAAAIQEKVRAVVQRLSERDARVADAVARHYAGLDAAAFAEAFQGSRRPPRVLLLTTRLSTVLQYSTRDTADAFERLGWEARVIIEPTPHHRVLRGAIAAALAEFKPDLVFQIDHLRHEHEGLFPANLPFACWIQDHLPHLGTADAGREVGEMDFVLTDAIATYADKFEYPARQCIPLPKLVVRTEPAERGEEPGDDLVFVSNASGTVDGMVSEALDRYGRNDDTRAVITDCCRSMADTYAAGGSLPTYSDVCAVLRRTLAGLGLALPAEGFDVLARWLTHPFNDALYRQQALRWAAEAATEHGLTLSLYGKGWESNPEFRPYARGPVAYGEPLRRLTRRSRINLQIVPYLCLHQRLLDGLMAGGFFLVRTHPADVSPAALLRFLEEGGGTGARTTADAFSALPAEKHAALTALVEQCRPCLCTTGAEDVVAMTRGWEEGGQLTARDGPLPMLTEVGFDDAKGLSLRVRKFAGSSVLRESVSTNQRRSVGARLSYDAGVRRVVGRVRELLDETAARQAAAAPRARGKAA